MTGVDEGRMAEHHRESKAQQRHSSDEGNARRLLKLR